VDTLKGMSPLQARKRELLLESEMNRQTLRLEFDHVATQVERVRSGWNWLPGGWRWLAPVASLALAWKFRKTAGLFAKGSMWLLLLRKLFEVWQETKAAEGEG